MQEADSLARSRGVTWVNTSIALSVTDDPDTVLHDTWYHGYDIWGTTWGNSPVKVAECYAAAVTYLRAGDTTNASVQIGLLSHYYSDTCNPLHTDQCDAEDGIHSSYESAVDDVTIAPGVPSGWVVDDGYVRVSDPAEQTRQAAYFAHPSYTALVNGYMSGRLPAVQPITQSSLNQAVNGVSDILCSITEDAGMPLDTDTVFVYRFYNMRTGTHFYTASYDERVAVAAKWPTIYHYEGVGYTLSRSNPANSQPLYRFYNVRTGTHFYTADPAEKNRVQYTMGSIYRLDGPAYNVSPTNVAGATTVWRFYNFKTGTHFYTADPAEKANVENNMRNTYSLDGPGFYLAP